MNEDKKNIIENYKEFLADTSHHLPPHDLGVRIRTEVMKDIDPNLFSVGINLLLIHVFMSSLTIIICPQFGIGPIGGGDGLMGIVAQYGHIVCGLFCGSFFFFGSILAASLILSKAQKRKINSNRYFAFFFLAIISLITLIILSSMINGITPHLHLEFIFSWLFAAYGSSILVSKITFITTTKFPIGNLK